MFNLRSAVRLLLNVTIGPFERFDPNDEPAAEGWVRHHFEKVQTMKILGALAASAFLLFAASEVSAMPIASSDMGSTDAPIVLARGGCGFGAHPGRFGNCRYNRGPRGAIRRAFGPRRGYYHRGYHR